MMTESDMTDGPLTYGAVAAEFGLTESDWRARVSRGHAPEPDRYERIDGAMRAVYDPETIAAYRAVRVRRTTKEG